jgi:dTDP-4-dehydrorhamnose reductase
MKILIVGATGFLGTNLYHNLSKDFDVFGTYYGRYQKGLYKLDTSKKESIFFLFKKLKPDIIIDTVSISNPDFCEQNKEQAYLINCEGIKNIVEACRVIKAKLVYFSSAYVFDGQKNDYIETDEPRPLNIYGKTKFFAEKEVFSLEKSVIFRCDMLYGFNSLYEPNGFFDQLLTSTQLVIDNIQKRKPLWINDASRAVKFVLEKKLVGIFHLSQNEQITKYKLSRLLESTIRNNSLLSPGKEKKKIAKRPKNSILDSTKIKSLGFIFTSLSDVINIISSKLNSNQFGNFKFCFKCHRKIELIKIGCSLSFYCENCNLTYYPQPSLAVAALFKKNKKLLLIKRNIEPFKNSWTLPSGFIEYGEEPIEALKREMEEELGVPISKAKLFFSKLGNENPRNIVLALYFLAELPSKKLQINKDEILETKWFDFDDLPEISFDSNNIAVKEFIERYVK